MNANAPDPTPAETLAAACRRLNILTTKAPEIFGVCRQTFSNWQAGKTKVPPEVFYKIVALENALADLLAEQAARVEERAAALRSIAATLNAGRAAADQGDRLTRRAKRR